MASNPNSDNSGIARQGGNKTPTDHTDEGDAVVDRAYAIYDSEIRHLVEPEHHGEYLTIDVKTGEYEIDADALAANRRMLEQHSPETLVSLRIGYPAFGRIGMRARPARGGETGVARRRGYKAPTTAADGAVVVDQAYAIYEAKIRHLVEPEHHGEYLALDVKTGEYEIDIDDMAANSRMLERHSPETLVMMRIGFPAFGTFVGWRGLMP